MHLEMAASSKLQTSVSKAMEFSLLHTLLAWVQFYSCKLCLCCWDQTLVCQDSESIFFLKETFKISVQCLTICSEFVSVTLYLTLFVTNLQLQIHIEDNFFASGMVSFFNVECCIPQGNLTGRWPTWNSDPERN